MATTCPETTSIASGTPLKTASEMSTTSRGGSVIGKVLKLGFCVPVISTAPAFTSTRVMVFSAAGLWAAADPDSATPSKSQLPAGGVTVLECYPPPPGPPRNEPPASRQSGQAGQHRWFVPVCDGVLHQVFDVVADLPDVVPHRQ